MSQIHYFPRYSQKENVVTNNTLLLLNRLYNFDRLRFDRFLNLLASDSDIYIQPLGLTFHQQIGTGNSIVDGYLHQSSLKIVIETKLYDSFIERQLISHCDILASGDQKILLMLSTKKSDFSSIDQRNIFEIANSRGIALIAVSFESLIQSFKSVLEIFNEEMNALINDFEGFCSDCQLLPKDERLMFIPPCAASFDENVRLKLYYRTAGQMKRKPRFLGIYANRCVRFIGEITKNVECRISISSETVEPMGDTTLTVDEKGRVLEATKLALVRGWDISVGSSFLLCDEVYATNFQKTTKGGIQGYRYADLTGRISDRELESAESVAKALSMQSWE